MNRKIYEYDEIIHCIPDKGGAYVIFPWNIRDEFGRDRVKVHAEFDLLYHRHYESHPGENKQRGRGSCPCDYKRKRIVKILFQPQLLRGCIFYYLCSSLHKSIDTGLLRMIQ